MMLLKQTCLDPQLCSFIYFLEQGLLIKPSFFLGCYYLQKEKNKLWSSFWHYVCFVCVHVWGPSTCSSGHVTGWVVSACVVLSMRYRHVGLAGWQEPQPVYHCVKMYRVVNLYAHYFLCASALNACQVQWKMQSGERVKQTWRQKDRVRQARRKRV